MFLVNSFGLSASGFYASCGFMLHDVMKIKRIKMLRFALLDKRSVVAIAHLTHVW